jgi:hypothetical protein
MPTEQGVPIAGSTNRGRYLKLCLATWKRASTGFGTTGSGFALETLVRSDGAPAQKSKPSVKDRAANHDRRAATLFEGEWQMVSGVMNGEPMEKSVVNG